MIIARDQGDEMKPVDGVKATVHGVFENMF
jgi:hypothetical protein